MMRSSSSTQPATRMESRHSYDRYVFAALLLLLVLCGCTTRNAPAVLPPADPMMDADYRAALDQLRALNAQAQEHWRNGEKALAAQALKEAQPLAKELLDVRRPSKEAYEAVSDFDQLYATVLLANGHTVWARQIFMTNAARWRNWNPQTEDTKRRLREAEQGAAEADKKMGLH
ncbi:MAG: hypothetical protein LC114_12810 [Bryobacterales bacterium]|nr:hypothetical protein [Bryobacterales bacterium]